jgi:transcriptional regulator with XRE-family HTH domain
VADFRTATSVGARIAAARKMRGFKSTKELAAAIPGNSVTGSILQNIEAGRKNDLAVAQLLNIAAALKLSPLFILAPLGSPHEKLDLPNISPAVAGMSVAEFDAWVSGLTDGSYRALSADELSERTQLEAFRELLAARRELRRLELRLRSEQSEDWQEAPTGPDDKAILDDVQFRIGETKRRISQLEIYLGSAGWGVEISAV